MSNSFGHALMPMPNFSNLDLIKLGLLYKSSEPYTYSELLPKTTKFYVNPEVITDKQFTPYYDYKYIWQEFC
ncbi:MAG: hypothetical protein J5I52_05255 [Saprospiraceae bacterium]|nr:hypothetical protein [Saprospiraceae bacterium]